MFPVSIANSIMTLLSRLTLITLPLLVVSCDESIPTHVEGYWASSKNEDSPYPWPIAHSEKWEGQDEFASKLARVENYMQDHGLLIYYRGLAPSRLDDSNVGSCEFY